jgi:hypothetical protein
MGHAKIRPGCRLRRPVMLTHRTHLSPPVLNPVGQVVNLRADFQSAPATPRKIARLANQPSPHRIHRNIFNNSPELFRIPNQPVVTLVLPKRAPSKPEHEITLPSRKPLQRFRNRVQSLKWRNKEMHMVRHNNKPVQHILLRIPVTKRLNHHLSGIGALQIRRTHTSAIENPIHRHECPPRRDRRREVPAFRQSPSQPPRDKNGSPRFMNMREPTSINSGHEGLLAISRKFLSRGHE